MNLTSCYLPLYGAARLEKGGKILPLRRKSLAILYYLALEGASRREHLAELLWPDSKGSVNLRAEIYYLRKKFSLDVATQSGLLTLPENVALDITQQNGEPLEGLEGLTADFDAWITRKRFEVEFQRQPQLMQRIARRLAAELPVPGLWILAGPIGTGKRRLARALADELDLPFYEGWKSGATGMVFLEEPLPAFEEIEKSPNWPRVLVLARPALGEEPSLLLGLRTVYPTERTRYLKIPRLSYNDAAGILGSLPFVDAARFYLRSHGRDELLEEMVQANHETPLKYRAVYKIEARRLRRKSRLALERISVCPEPINAELAHRMGSEEDLEELERRGWLVYDHGWRFSDPVARRALEYDLPDGLKIQYHQRAAIAWEQAGKTMLSAWHQLQAGEITDLQLTASRSGNRYAAALLTNIEQNQGPPQKKLAKGGLVPLLESKQAGEGLERRENHWLILRPEYAGGAAWLEFEPLETDAIVQVSGQLWSFAPLFGALQEKPPLALHVGEKRFWLAPVNAAQEFLGGWLLPAKDHFSYNFFLPANTPLALVSEVDEVAAEIDVQAFAVAERGSPELVL